MLSCKDAPGEPDCCHSCHDDHDMGYMGMIEIYDHDEYLGEMCCRAFERWSGKKFCSPS